MNQEPIFDRVSGALLEHLRGELVPVVLGAADAIKLTHPGAEEEFRLGVYLYDIEEVRSGGPPAPVRLSDAERRFPDLTLALHFLIFVNRKTAFNSMEAGDEMLLLEAALRAVHALPGLELDGRRFSLALRPLARGEKTSLWQSLNRPLQPAVYLTLEPVPVPSSRILRIPPVREVEVSAQYREKG